MFVKYNLKAFFKLLFLVKGVFGKLPYWFSSNFFFAFAKQAQIISKQILNKFNDHFKIICGSFMYVSNNLT